MAAWIEREGIGKVISNIKVATLAGVQREISTSGPLMCDLNTTEESVEG